MSDQKPKLTDEQVADKMIAMMQSHGCTPDDMLRIISLARKMYHERKAKENENNRG